MAITIAGSFQTAPLSWMQFVDGENFTIRGQDVAKQLNLDLRLYPDRFRKDCFLWPLKHGRTSLGGPGHGPELQRHALRSHYYASSTGAEEALEEIRKSLRALEFEPRVFKRDKSTKRSKGVDITLATEMLAHGFRGNYDAVVLVTGDGDYVPLVEEVKRLGKLVHIHFFGKICASSLKLAADCFVDITSKLQANFSQRMETR